MYKEKKTIVNKHFTKKKLLTFKSNGYIFTVVTMKMQFCISLQVVTMKKYQNVHTGNAYTKKQWIRQFEEIREEGDFSAIDTFNILVKNGDLKECKNEG